MEFAGYSRAEIKAVIDAVGGLPLGKCTLEVYDEKLGGTIERSISRRAVLRVELNTLGEYAATMRWKSDVDNLTPHQLTCRFDRIAKTAKTLLKAVGAGPGGEVDAITDQYLYGYLAAVAAENAAPLKLRSDLPGKALLKISFRHVAFLRDCARDAAQRTLAEGKRGRRERNLGDVILQDHVDGLIDVYSRVFNRAPGTSISSKGKGGPLLRFLEKCLRPVHGDATPIPAALRSLVRRTLSLRKGGQT